MKEMRCVIGISIAFILMSSYMFAIPGIKGRIVDSKGNPIEGAYVFYAYKTPAKSIPSYYYGAFTRTDRRGFFSIPGKTSLYAPFLGLFHSMQKHLSVYVLVLHNFCYIYENTMMDGSSTCKRISNDSFSSKFVIQIDDMGDNDEQWYRMLWNMIYGGHIISARAPKQLKLELVSAIKKEYERFVSRYGKTIRQYTRGKSNFAREDDWVKWDGKKKPWNFFLGIKWYGKTMVEKLSEIEKAIQN